MKLSYAERARALVGTRFRAQGRGKDGVDCVGLILLAFDVDAVEFRKNYRLRGDHLSEIEQGLLQQFRRVARRDLRPGDVMLMRVADDQLHLGVLTRDGFVHAHAGIGFVVETPGATPWPVIGTYRKRTRRRNG